MDTLPSAPLAAWDRRAAADVVVIGAGIAGLSFAIRLPDHLRVIVVTKGTLGESNTRYAQGGMAAAVGPDDNADLHTQDTIEAGAGLTDPEAARALAERGASAVRWLLMQGARFDLDGPLLALGQEAALSRRRILHAGGDATGAEIERALVERLRSRAHTTVLQHTIAIDLARTTDGAASGAIVRDEAGALVLLDAPLTVLAAGGIGQLWTVTSNPEVATADGIAMALRAGADLADLEFTQFHPTVLNAPGITPFLISEAVRGEGAWLVNGRGERFMRPIDPRAELAPRNVVAGAIQAQLMDPESEGVYLDLRHLDAAFVRARFPTIAATLADAGFDLASDLLPVAPAMHYYMGGVVAGVEGHTSMPGLLALGEVSCSGVHGANRLASNSLLEGLVFGINAADAVSARSFPARGEIARGPVPAAPETPAADVAAVRTRVQEIMCRDVGVVRDEAGLRDAVASLRALPRPEGLSVPAIEARNMIDAALQIAISALNRRESRGGHIRSDYPQRDPALDGHHQRVRRAGGRLVRSFGPLFDDTSDS